MLPRPRSPAEALKLPASPTIAQALAVMRIESLLASLKTALPQDAIVSGRLKDFPGEALRANRHMTRVMVPVSVAHLLKHRPHLISKIVETFFTATNLTFAREPDCADFPATLLCPNEFLLQHSFASRAVSTRKPHNKLFILPKHFRCLLNGGRLNTPATKLRFWAPKLQRV